MNQLAVAVRCSALTKRYGTRLALDRLDLTVNDGEVVGLLGANGAGKTTILRLLLGLIRPDAGSAALLGRPVPSPRALAQVGAMLEEPAFYPWLDGRANLMVLLDAGRHVHGSSIDAAIDLVDLNDVADDPVRTYSQGMRQRLGLALALARRPRLLLLDEPTNGLDPPGIHRLRDLLVRLRDMEVTVVLASHLLTEVERLCDRVAVLHRGRLAAIGAVGDIGDPSIRVRVTVRREDENRALDLLRSYAPKLVQPGVLAVRCGSGREVNGTLAEAGVIAEMVVVEQSSLEERFFALIEETDEVDRVPAQG